jgi:hypothetical protein
MDEGRAANHANRRGFYAENPDLQLNCREFERFLIRVSALRVFSSGLGGKFF